MPGLPCWPVPPPPPVLSGAFEFEDGLFAVEPDIALLPPPEFVGVVAPLLGDDDFLAGGPAWLPPVVPPPEPPPPPPVAVGGESVYSGGVEA